MHTTCPTYLTFLDLITQILFREEYKLLNFSLRSFLHPYITSSPLGPNILLSILFSNTLYLCSYIKVRVQVSHPYKTTGKVGRV